ncbi:MAG TPA: acyl-CoA reductase [Bacteriovoracaceae bacterium]|nr:acyl-CoA reductase [Bacteriovoracaceae bacterium]
MYWFGKKLSHEKPWESDSAWKDLSLQKLKLARTPVSEIIDILDSFSKLWNPESPYFKEALLKLESSSGFSPLEVRKTLSILPVLLSKESLGKRVKAEFFPSDILDRFSKTPHFSGQVRAMPLGTLLHVTAGNVFLSSIDSLLMGLITKNLNILKVSSQNTFFPLFFAEKLAAHDTRKVISDKFAVLHWKGGDETVEKLFKAKVDGILAWGGDEMMDAYSKGLAPHVKFLGFGPKISLQLMTKSGLKDKNLNAVAEKIVADILPWDQSACASPQNLYIQEGINENELMQALELAFSAAPAMGNIDADESVEIMKEKFRGMYSELMEGGKVSHGDNYLLHLEQNKFIKPSPLHRSLIIKRFKDLEDLFTHLSPFSYYLQSCSYLVAKDEKDAYLEMLSMAGIKRFAPLGTITFGMEGAPHDGRTVLRELTHMVSDESRSVYYGEKETRVTGPLDIKIAFENEKHPKGYIFSSGGTTGEPKFLHFSYEEFEHTTDMLAHNLSCQGITAGMTVANLFVAGNLWSSFIAMERALEKIGAIQLPIGGLCSPENTLLYLKKFKPDVVMGIPSLLIMTAEFAQEQGVLLEIPKVFYAGEALSLSRRNYLRDIWKTAYFGSAGYASVDAGMIAYQCSKCGPGEHHLFSDLVEMKIVEGEGVVTSHYRKTLPIVNYRTGDRIEWVDDTTCGRTDKKFKLMGRIDNIIQIWSCRVRMDDIEKSISQVVPDVKSYQVILSEEKVGDKFREIMEVLLEEHNGPEELLINKIYENSRDLKDSISLGQFQSLISIRTVGLIPRNSRTGKISLLKDQRH